MRTYQFAVQLWRSEEEFREVMVVAVAPTEHEARVALVRDAHDHGAMVRRVDLVGVAK